MLAGFQAGGLLKARGRPRTDATPVLAALRAPDRLETVGATLRHALTTLAVGAPAWLPPHREPAWADRYGPRCELYRLPKTRTERYALAEQIGQDGFRGLAAVTAPEAPAWRRAVPAVETLRQVWGQQYHAPTAGGRWRGSAALPPAGRLLNSPSDVAARYRTNRDGHWVGYQAPLTEACEPDAPPVLTPVESTAGTTVDGEVLPRLHAALVAKQCPPGEHRVDTGYVASETLGSSEQTPGLRVVGPVLPDSPWPARAGEGFDSACFRLDWEARRATCPRGRPRRKWSVTPARHGSEIINIRFARADCQRCPSRAQCTRSQAGPREITVRPQAQHVALQAARQRQTTAEFPAEYHARAGVEGTLSQGLRGAAWRPARYVGLAKVRLQHGLTAAGLNLRRLGAWWEERSFAPTRQPRVAARLASSP